MNPTSRVSPVRCLCLLALAALVLLVSGGRALAQYPQPLPEAPSEPQFLSRYDFHLAAAGLGSGIPERFQWDTHWGGDFDLVDYVSGRFGFLVDYQAVLGNEFRSFDPNQGNYTLEFSGSKRFGRTEVAAVFHHVSRHLSDRPKRFAVAMNALEARVLRRFQLGATSLVDVKAEAGHITEKAYVDYTWMGKLDVTARHDLNSRAGVYGRGYADFYATDQAIAGFSRSGRSEMNALTPQPSRRVASSGVSTVHTWTPRPAACAYSTNRRETTRVAPAISGTW